MKKYISVILLFTIILFTNSLFAQLDRSIQPKPGPAPEFKIGESKLFTLDNGLKVIVVENHKIPRVSYQLSIDVDPILENDAVGYIEMVGDLMKTGSMNKSKAEIDEAIDFIGAEFDTFQNGMYGVALTKYRHEFLAIMSDVLLNPSYPDEEIEKSKKQQISSLVASKTDPEFIANRVGQKLRNGNHPFSEIVTEATIENITRAHLTKYYNTYYKPNTSYLVIIGDITLKDAKKDAEKYFGSWEKGDVPTHEYQFPNKNVGTRVVFINKEDAVQSYINITYPVNLKTGDTNDIPALLANSILGSGAFSSRLLSNLRADKGYTYGAYSSLSKSSYVGSFSAFAQVKSDVTEDAVNQFIIEMDRMKNELVDEETLDLFKTIRTGRFARSLENPQTIARFALSTIKYDLPSDYYQKYLTVLDAVTSEQIQSASKKYIDADQAIIVVVGDKAKLLESLKKFSSTGEVEIFDIYGNPVKEEKATVIPDGLTAETVLEKFIDAIGGKDSIEKIQDVTMIASTSMNGMEIKQTIYKKAPNKYASITTMNGNVLMQQSYNGERGLMKGFQGEKEITGDELEALKVEATVSPELKYKELGIKVSLEAIEKINEKDAYKLKLVSQSGQKSYDYYDVNSGLKVQTKQTITSPQGDFVQTFDFSDYQEINGVKFPYVLRISGMQNLELKVDSINVNTDLSDDLF